MNDNRIQLNGIKVHPFPSDSSLLEYVEEHKGILVAINAEKILQDRPPPPAGGTAPG